MKRVRQKETNIYYPTASNMTTIVETEESHDRDDDGIT